MGPDKLGKTAFEASANKVKALSTENETVVLTAFAPTSVANKFTGAPGQ